MTAARISAGVPTGGQFAPTGHTEADVDLDTAGSIWPPVPIYGDPAATSETATSEAEAHAAQQDADAEIRELEEVAKYSDDQEQLDCLADHEHPWVVAALPKNPATPEHVLSRLADHPAPLVRLAVAERSSDRNTLSVLREDSNIRVAEAAAKGYDRAVRKAAAEKKLNGETTVHIGSRTPWGAADDVVHVAPGIASVGTPGHGGFKLSPERNKRVHPAWRQSGGWYEEDCASAIPMVTFPEAFPAEHQDFAHASAKNWYPDAYEKVTGEQIVPGESLVRDKQLFHEAHASDHVVVSATSSDAHPGMVEVSTQLGGRDSGHVEQRKRFLVPREEYRASDNRFGFVIDPDRHAEMI